MSTIEQKLKGFERINRILSNRVAGVKLYLNTDNADMDRYTVILVKKQGEYSKVKEVYDVVHANSEYLSDVPGYIIDDYIKSVLLLDDELFDLLVPNINTKISSRLSKKLSRGNSFKNQCMLISHENTRMIVRNNIYILIKRHNRSCDESDIIRIVPNSNSNYNKLCISYTYRRNVYQQIPLYTAFLNIKSIEFK